MTPGKHSAKSDSTNAREHLVRGDTRSAILDAAEEIISSQGAQALTLDAVYRLAGISKGGLLYHFPSKEALVDGMIGRYMKRLDAQEKNLRQRFDPTEQGDPLARASIAQILAESPVADRLGAALLAAVANDIERLAPLREQVRRRFRDMHDSPIGFEAAAIVELAVNGLFLLELLRLPAVGPVDRRSILQALDRIASGQAASSQQEPSAPA